MSNVIDKTTHFQNLQAKNNPKHDATRPVPVPSFDEIMGHPLEALEALVKPYALNKETKE